MPVATSAQQRGDRWFTTSFVDNQIMAHSFAMFIPTEEEVARAKGTEALGASVFVWWEGRVRAWWTLVWSSYTRASSVMLWLPYAPLILIPWIVDGWVMRERRKHTFEFASPIKQRFALIAVVIMPFLFLLLLTAPIVMHPMVTPVALIASALLIHQAIANFMKRA